MKQIGCLIWGLVSSLLTCSPISDLLSEPQVRSIANHVRPDRQSERILCCYDDHVVCSSIV